MATELTPLEARVSRNMREKIAGARLSTQQLAEATGLSPESIRRRGRDEAAWAIADLGRLEPLLGVEAADLLK